MRPTLRQALLALLLLMLAAPARADEGMWLPLLLKQLNEADMQKKGLKLTADQIYSINQGSLKDAVVQFGGGCTGEIISNEGLLLTNHHCGYGQIQQHSSVEQDYLTKGYWAMDRSQELTNPGLTATFIIRMEDVTGQVLAGVPTANIAEADREKLVQTNIQRISQAAVQGTHYQAFIRPFYNGNEYYMFVTEVFQDIRLVGAPPSSIGKFGGDTDNWAWPRHTGDFSIFRIYAGPDNKPAPYSAQNVPFKPRHHLPISLAGVQPGDFTLVFGFPGRTNEYLTSWGVDEVYSVSNPAKIKVRDARLRVLDADMKASDKVRIQYAAKYAGIANYWKKWIGENRGLKKLDAVRVKQEQEVQFQQWANSGDEARRAAYAPLLPQLQKQYATVRDYTLARDYVTEAALGIELIAYANSLLPLAEMADKAPAAELAAAVDKARGGTTNFFKNSTPATDQKVAAALLPLYANGTPPTLLPAYVKTLQQQYAAKGGWNAYVTQLYGKSRLTSEAGAQAVLNEVAKGNARALLDDPAAQLASAIVGNYRTAILPTYTAATDQIALLQRTYVAGLRQQQTTRKFYPDANSTLRVAYGQVQPYAPADGTKYDFYTTLDGIMEKADPTNPEFEVPARLAELYKNKDYGPYAYKGTVPVAFIATNHTTGGNSGSPVINGRGELIGTNFDRNWEGTMSDIMFDPDRVRNITLDVRYMLFVVDKFAGAGHLVKEMTLVGASDAAAPTDGKKVKKVKVKKKEKADA
ncbi:S46 family peptidase [Hymenobacter puniceus]|uniref:S46 family peptidase n=1 Tax=Hymenobacter sp. BT190 TaxID=2763505 RepID=UPI001651A5D1|nr:S46 family peptidase [Hymenobacter sp. BT190]MBC6698658.1 S46 family peptidase [Hymenobacter sp. BT190]